MKIADIPSKFAVPFANGAGGGYIRAIPQTSQIGITNGAASLVDGFPPLTFLPVGSGGVPPFGQDFNGILNQITKWSRWGSAGGLSPYDAAFSTAIGGYPQNALIAGTVAGVVYISLVDDNTSNPNTGGAGWSAIPTAAAILDNLYTYSADTGGPGSIVVTLSPSPSAYATGMSFYVKVAAACAGATTINVNGLGPKQAGDTSGAVPIPGAWQAGDILELIYDGTLFRVACGNTVSTSTSVLNVSTSTSRSISNNVSTQLVFGDAGGSNSFGTYTQSSFIFSRPGIYCVSSLMTAQITFSGGGNLGTFCFTQIRKNGNAVIGGINYDQSNQFSPVYFQENASAIVPILAGDTVQIWGNLGVSANFTSGTVTSVSLAITPIS